MNCNNFKILRQFLIFTKLITNTSVENRLSVQKGQTMALDIQKNLTKQQRTMAFKGGKNKFFGQIKNHLSKMSKEDRMLEQSRGMMAALDAKKLGIDECSDILLRETLALNFDFLKGFNQVLGKDMAKKAYSNIGK